MDLAPFGTGSGESPCLSRHPDPHGSPVIVSVRGTGPPSRPARMAM